MTTPDSTFPEIDQLWDYNQPAESEKRFRKALAEVADRSNPSLFAEILTQIARSQGLQRKFDDAHQTLDEAEGLLSSLSQRAKMRLLLERGRVYNSSGRPERARLLFLQAWEMACESGEDFYAVDAAHMVAIVELPDEQLAWNFKALELAESSAQPRARRWLGSLYNNIGWTYHNQGEYGRALEFFQKALQWQEEQGKPYDVRVARWCVARALRSLQRYPEALAVQRSLLDEMEKIGEVDGYIYEEVAENLLQMGQSDAARPFFTRAYRELSKDPWLAEQEPDRLARLHELGRV